MKKLISLSLTLLLNCSGSVPKCTDEEIALIVPALQQATALTVASTVTQQQKDSLKPVCDKALKVLDDNTGKACSYEDSNKKTQEISHATLEKKCNEAQAK